MRWQGKPTKGWTPWFAFLPLRWCDDRMIWLEPIWVRWAGDYSAWCPWEDRPNDPAESGAGVCQGSGADTAQGNLPPAEPPLSCDAQSAGGGE